MTLRVGILGAGIMGQAHAQAYLEVGAIINGVVDINQTKAIALADRFGCAAYTSAKDLLKEDIDAVSICLPHNLHLDAALQVASHGKHVLMEKPLAITLVEAKAIINACETANVRLMVGFIMRFFTTLQELRSLIADGSFGEIGLVVDYLAAGGSWLALPGWYLKREMSGGGINMIGNIHSIDRIRWLLNSEVDTVYAVNRQIGSEGDVEDVGTATMVYKNGTQASIIGYRSPLKTHRRRHTLEIYGTRAEASLSLTHDHEQLLEITDQAGSRTVTVTDDNPFLKEIREFVTAIEEDRDPSPDGYDGLVSLATILAMYNSAERKEPISLTEFMQQ